MSSIYYRLIAIWVLCEAMLGGIIHGARIPVSGLIVGSCAVICICLIASYVPKKGAILKATLVVAIFKMMLSPQASLPAYFAVMFQGVMGEVLFWNRRYYKLSCILLALLALVESGLQRILVLVILYGNDLWTAINDFINRITKEKTPDSYRETNYSWWIAAGYVAIHFITGLIVGWWASVLPKRIERWRSDPKNLIEPKLATDKSLSTPYKRRRLRKLLFIIWIVLIVLYLQSYFKIGEPLLPSNIVLRILVRSFIIVLSWIFIVSPLLKQVLHSWLQKKQTRWQYDIQQVIQLLPATRMVFTESWNRTKGIRGWRKLKTFGRLVLVNALGNEVKQVYILSAPIQSGKTTSLMEWSKNRKDLSGILTPVIDGKRVFHDLESGREFPMEASASETETLVVGRFVFSKKAFQQASQIIRDAIQKDGVLVIDEIGPLELRNEGFAAVLREILSKRPQTLLLVVREGLVENVIDHFNISNVQLITDVNEVRFWPQSL